jgi:hypothetical protein
LRAFLTLLLLLSSTANTPATAGTQQARNGAPATAGTQQARNGATRAEVAARWAPTIHQETRDHRDLIAAFDFDGDWDLGNNRKNLDRRPLAAVVYYTVAETETHHFITYLPYHPVDAKSPSGHDHDTEHIRMAVRKDGSRDGRLEVLETRFHKWFYQYAAPEARIGDRADDVDGPIHFDHQGRPTVSAQRVGHGLCGGFAPTAWWDALALECRHDRPPRLARGVVYRFRGRAEVPRSLDDRDVGYALVEIGATLWPRAQVSTPNATFASLADFRGARCGKYLCPRSIGSLLAASIGHGTTRMVWQESPGRGADQPGEAFFDPAYTLSRRLRFPPPFSVEYTFNPYLGVGRFDL